MGFLVNPMEGLRKAANYCTKCNKMGGAWLRWDDMSEGWEYLWLLREFREEMDESWSMCKKRFEHLQVKFVEAKNIKIKHQQ